MSLSLLIARWRGLALSLLGVLATVLLALSGQLGFYIHPRYTVFTIVMAAIAAVLIVGAFAVGTDEEDDDDHEEHEDHEGHEGHASQAARRRRPGALFGAAGSVLVVVVAAVALFAVPPTPLTSSALQQRDLNGSAGQHGSLAPAAALGDDTSGYTVKDWAALIRQGTAPDDLAGRSATLTGFVTPDTDDPENVFFVARFVVTCCAVDAQPVGVAVYLPHWADTLSVDDWVTAEGTFEPNPSVLSLSSVALDAVTVTPIDEPSEPYVY
ncbi:TIGR03943 family putative permease subunit [Herbiconiux solani]|uniref:TIGR03943 family putative permease subunit n=1 Tax=Herbiconiux solani TaxID=661329 RepID=UPI0008260589|nr:TIGR03943 family protein [Herbiconiux solani]